jgi:UDP-N-acetylglucosamine:LPS N-acetylglucosamine transferase
VFETKPKKVAMIIKEWLKDDGEKLKILASKAKGLGKPDSLFQIVRDLSTMILPSSPGFRAMNQNVA